MILLDPEIYSSASRLLAVPNGMMLPSTLPIAQVLEPSFRTNSWPLRTRLSQGGAGVGRPA